jgi:hypothetical protein
MRYQIQIHENESPSGVRFWATVAGLDGCLMEEESIDDLYRNAPGIIRDVIQTSNEHGANLAQPTHFEFRLLANA